MAQTTLFMSKHDDQLAHPVFNGKALIEEFHYRFYSNFNYASGGIFSNNGELLHFFDHLFEKQTLLNSSSLEHMTTFQNRYGMGLKRYEINDKTYWSHPGDNLSYAVRSFYNPESGTVIILGANTFTPEFLRPLLAEILGEV